MVVRTTDGSSSRDCQARDVLLDLPASIANNVHEAETEPSEKRENGGEETRTI